MYIVNSKLDWQDAITNKWHPQPTVLAAHGDFAINKSRCSRLTINQVSVVLIVSVGACMQGVLGSNLTDD